MLIQASILGAAADPKQWKFSCIKEDGSLDEEKYAAFMRFFAHNGANCTRELPFLTTDRNYLGDTKQRNFLPFKFKGGRYDLKLVNPVFFQNLKAMIKIANRHNLAFQYSMFDRSHSLRMPDSPWNLNHQDKRGYYTWDQYTNEYVNRILLTIHEAESELIQEGIICKMLFELENEPFDNGFTATAIETLKRILSSDFKKEQIEDGVFYLPMLAGKPIIEKINYQLIKNPLFEALKRAKRKAGLYPGEGEKDKSRYFTTIHQVDKLIINELIIALKHTRRFSISCDGEKPKPYASQWFDRLLPLFQAAKGLSRREQLLETWKIEHVYRGTVDGESQFGDAIDGILGISQAYHHVFNRLPENFGKFPEVIGKPLPEPLPILQQIKLLKDRVQLVKQQVEENRIIINQVKEIICGKE